MNGKIIAGKLHNIGNSIKGAMSNPEILEKLKALGYPEERIREGVELWNKTNQLMVIQVNEYGNQYAASVEQEKFLEVTYGEYMVIVKVSRVALKKQPDMLARLGLTGKRPRSLSGWLRSGRILYTNILETPEALKAVNDLGITFQRLQEGLKNIEKIEDLHVKQLGEKSAAQQATKERDKTFDELCDWYSDFRAIARVALYDNPQLLEAMGIVKK
jgi:hypothetical protein